MDSPDHGSVAVQLALPPMTAASVHHITAQNLEDISIGCEFSGVFLKDLSGMPLNRDVEFTIELQLDTAPISKRSYKMILKELAELKVQL
jgi:hypothetical protein